MSDPSAREKDPKWRFFWRCGNRPPQTDFPELNAAQVVPAAFASEWAPTMDAWGHKLLSAVHTVARMLAIGLKLEPDALVDKLHLGPHLLAPTGTDLSRHGECVGATIAGFHYDLNVLTIHGRARFPGLYVWTRDGRRVAVAVPDGYLLVQAGVQLEHLTGGRVRRGMHEVVVSEQLRDATRRARAAGECLWRVSSTLFAHVRSDASLKPFAQFADEEGVGAYGDVRAGEQVAEELRAIELAF